MPIEPMICELSVADREGIRFPDVDVPVSEVPQEFLRVELNLPEVSEVDVVRHFTRLSQLNYAVDKGFYPLGSCTMKYNPRVNEDNARLTGFSQVHPLQPEETVQGCMKIMYQLQQALMEIGGFAGVSLQPAAGAHGEMTGVLILHAYHQHNKQYQRRKILIPDSAHGTNPASSAMVNMQVVEIPSDERGNIDLEVLKTHCDETLAGLMITNPNTLGLFEENILEISQMVHEAGGLIYGDGANLNALVGVAKPGDLGIDILHYNLHKTFSTPHGGGGPGSGPVGVRADLVEFLPAPIVGIRNNANDYDEGLIYEWVYPSKSIGRVKAFYGHFGIFVRALTYILMHGADGLRSVAEHAVLNANYVKSKIENIYHIPYPRRCMHEFVAEGVWQDVKDVHALDVAKRIIDYGFHPPTNYFPLIVHEALMIEPTETESKEVLDNFAEAMIKIAKEAREQPTLLTEAPHFTPVGRIDEVKAAKDLILCCSTKKYD